MQTYSYFHQATKNVDTSSLEVYCGDVTDAPRFESASWSYAEFDCGLPLTEIELENLSYSYPVPFETVVSIYF